MPTEMADIASAQTHVGAKIALFSGDALVVYLRDDIPSIPEPNQWDFAGGEREADETALVCALRETHEEFGLQIPPHQVHYASSYPSHQPGRADVAFFVATVTEAQVASIRFGDEGQCWRMMPVDTFLTCSDAVKELQFALARYIAGL